MVPLWLCRSSYLAVGQNLRYLFGDDYPPKVVYFKGFLGAVPFFSDSELLLLASILHSGAGKRLTSWTIDVSSFSL